ncbi:Gfo/Idh/MocA family oxidoreductase [Helicobacter jaachi]|uniref:Gfo/Idh/MocA family oxidoreductase n=1 Tax=Helicobacter jaachi TaxID=1677920 RepID=A0A4U8TEJ3_9HELI|nr:Gfo/Idh/MocA family oxidoreductase [Helicobacter jaachi]TLD97768.1 Gfo/Idh/MocA family oxidoreductase [Helicobacter jaachi]
MEVLHKTFGLIGVGGFVAPRHLQAIKQNNGDLLCAIDVHDSVGILDSYFPQAHFFTESERFERYLDKRKRHKAPLDFISICSPNYLHDTHIRLALRNQSCAICEKPIVLNPWNLDALIEAQKESGYTIYTILQLRLHSSIIALKNHIDALLRQDSQKVFNVDLSYITSRGRWYFQSWKGDESKSGGVATNIGVHFFDMLLWIFGKPKESIVHIRNEHTASGLLCLEHARVRWFLSINEAFLPHFCKSEQKKVYRALSLEGEEFAFSEGFNDLHTKSYEQILCGKGFNCTESKDAIRLIHNIRHSEPIGLKGDYHPLNIEA